MPLILLLEALGGLGLFILGMKTMSEGLQKLAGARLRSSLDVLVGNRLTAAFFGSGLTAMLQSGSVASIIIIGMVNAGLLSLYQALGMLLGTGLGTTFAVQLMSFKISLLSAPGVVVGVFLKIFSKNRKWVYTGEVLLGLGLLFLGLRVMEINFAPLKQSPIFTSQLFTWPVLSVLTGAFLTFVVQSGSSAIAMVIALSGAGVIPVSSAVAMVLGESVGTSCLAALGAINGTIAARRTALLNVLISLSSVTIILLIFPFFLNQIHALDLSHAGGVTRFLFTGGSGSSEARAIANAHAVFSILVLFIFLPMVGFFTRWAGKILPVRRTNLIDVEPRLEFIDFRVVNTPTLALQQAKTELRRMAEIARTMLSEVVLLFEGFDAKKATFVKIEENVLDTLQKDIAHFLVILARQPLPNEVSVAIPSLLRIANELESIGDNAEIIFDCLRRKKEENVYFSQTAMEEIRTMAEEVMMLLGRALDCLSQDRADKIESKASIDRLSKIKNTLKNNHLCRLSSGNCTVIAGLLYIDIISAFATIGQSAVAVMEAREEIA